MDRDKKDKKEALQDFSFQKASECRRTRRITMQMRAEALAKGKPGTQSSDTQSETQSSGRDEQSRGTDTVYVLPTVPGANEQDCAIRRREKELRREARQDSKSSPLNYLTKRKGDNK